MGDILGEKGFKLQQYLLSRIRKPAVPSLFGYRLLAEGSRFRVYERPIAGKKLEAAWENVAVVSRGRKKRILEICPDARYPQLFRSVPFDGDHFPGLIPGSEIVYCRVLPYLRKVSQDRAVRSWRVMVVTDREQIYHNFPDRDPRWEGESRWGDMTRFEESAVWDLPGRRYPSQNRDCAPWERYYPGLPEEAYALHPAATEEGFPAVYEEGGRKLCRFYVAKRIPEANPFFYMSGFASDNKMSLLATYQSNVTQGVRTCVFASDDGGRQWFCKYEFGDLGEYAFQQGSTAWGQNFGNPISLPEGQEKAPFTLRRRTCVVPTRACPEPETSFSWEKEIRFTRIPGGDSLTLRSDLPHGLRTGNIVTVTGAPEDCRWMVNGDVDPCSAGNGLLFKVKVLDEVTVSLYEFAASPDNPISCRHIHHINRVRDGWLIGTGEIYPNSWILYLQMREADFFSPRSAAGDFDIFRLNSGENSVQRTLGTIWRDDGDNTFFYASDHDDLEGKTAEKPIPGRSAAFSRNATGVYRGKLRDIDDVNRFRPVYESIEPAYLFQELNGALVFSGQGGELALSFDGGTTWDSTRLPRPLNHPRGSCGRCHIYDNYLLEIR